MNQYGFDGLEQKIGYIYKDKKLLRQAMTHTSFANEQKMNKLKTVDSKVLSILRECPETRYDDMQLILCYYNRYSYLKVGDLSLEDIVNNYKGYGLPCFETIRRSRQRVQSLFPELSRQCSGCDSSIRVVIEIE